MILIDTSLWIALYRDRRDNTADKLARAVGEEAVSFAPFVITEVLQGARNDVEWKALSEEIGRFPRLEIPPTTWSDAARIYFDLQRNALTLRGTVDCLIAQLCLFHDCTLLHNDRDFEKIATVRDLKQRRLDLDKD